MLLPFGIMLQNEPCEMALHRDIFWIGRQWAVTGSGCRRSTRSDEGQFDIPIERLWDDDLPNGAREQKWFQPRRFQQRARDCACAPSEAASICQTSIAGAGGGDAYKHRNCGIGVAAAAHRVSRR